jgi:type VI protein secretion system component Hcp
MPVPGRWYGRLAALLAAVVLAATLGYVLVPGARARPAAIQTADLAAKVVRGGQVTATTQYPIFMKVAGIPGQSTDPDHPNWISLTSWQWDITGTGTSLQPLPAQVQMLINRAVPPMLTAEANSTVIPTVLIQFVAVSGTTEAAYLTMQLSNVTITRFSANSSHAYPRQAFELTYQKVSYNYPYNGKNYTFCYSLVSKSTC